MTSQPHTHARGTCTHTTIHDEFWDESTVCSLSDSHLAEYNQTRCTLLITFMKMLGRGNRCNRGIIKGCTVPHGDTGVATIETGDPKVGIVFILRLFF